MPDLPMPMPAAIVLLTGLVALIGGSLLRRRRTWAAVCVLGFIGAGVAAGTMVGRAGSGTETVRGLELLFDVLLLGSGLAFTAMLAGLPSHASDTLASRPEGALAPGLVTLSTGGAMLVAFAADTLVLVLGLELTAMPLVVLLLRTPGSAVTRGAALRFLASEALGLLGILAGLGLFHAEIGATNLLEMQQATLRAPDTVVTFRPASLLSVATVLLLCGLAIRARIAPFHTGTDRVHAATNSWTAGVLSVLPRIAVTAFLVKLMPVLANVDGATARLVCLVLAIAAILAGGVGAVWRTNLREVLAAVTMCSFGGVWACLAVGLWDVDHVEQSLVAGTELPGGIETAVVQLSAYVLITVGLYATLVHLARPERPVDFEDDLAGLFHTEPAAAVSLTILLLAVAGLPPLVGFWSRLLTLASLASVTGDASSAYVLTALVVALGGMLLLAVFARWLPAALFEPPRTAVRPSGGEPALAVAVLVAVLTVGIGFLPGPVLAWIRTAVAAG